MSFTQVSEVIHRWWKALLCAASRKVSTIIFYYLLNWLFFAPLLSRYNAFIAIEARDDTTLKKKLNVALYSFHHALSQERVFPGCLLSGTSRLQLWIYILMRLWASSLLVFFLAVIKYCRREYRWLGRQKNYDYSAQAWPRHMARLFCWNFFRRAHAEHPNIQQASRRPCHYYFKFSISCFRLD